MARASLGETFVISAGAIGFVLVLFGARRLLKPGGEPVVIHIATDPPREDQSPKNSVPEWFEKTYARHRAGEISREELSLVVGINPPTPETPIHLWLEKAITNCADGLVADEELNKVVDLNLSESLPTRQKPGLETTSRSKNKKGNS